jgi:hypothetical protein
MNSTTESYNYDQMSNQIMTNNIKPKKKKEVSNSKKSLKISHRKRNFRYKPY